MGFDPFSLSQVRMRYPRKGVAVAEQNLLAMPDKEIF
jgi:hypothetical protein